MDFGGPFLNNNNNNMPERIDPYLNSGGGAVSPNAFIPPNNQIINNNNMKSNQKNNQNPKKYYKYTISSKMLKNAFKNFCIDNSYLNKKRFNDALESIFQFQLPEIHYTYLSEKIFNFINTSGDGKISEEDFCKRLGLLLKDENHRLFLSMILMMTIPNKAKRCIELNEIKEFFFRSFIEGYKHLGWQINRHANEFKDKGLPVASISQLEGWARGFEKEIKDWIENDLKKFGGGQIMDTVAFDLFKKWIRSNDYTLYIQYGNKKIKIATNLILLDEVGFSH